MEGAFHQVAPEGFAYVAPADLVVRPALIEPSAARDMLRCGASVTAIGSDKRALETTGRKLSSVGKSFELMQLDVTDEPAVVALFKDKGAVDIIINNAGIAQFPPPPDAPGSCRRCKRGHPEHRAPRNFCVTQIPSVSLRMNGVVPSFLDTGESMEVGGLQLACRPLGLPAFW